MFNPKASALAVFGTVCLLTSEIAGPASACMTGQTCATEWSNGHVIELGGLPGSTYSVAYSINDAGQAVGESASGHAIEWSGGSVIDLGPGSAHGINDAGQVVGVSSAGATEWSGGSVIDLPNVPGSTFGVASAINDVGQVVGYSYYPDGRARATEWSGGSVINLGGALPGSAYSYANGINDGGQVVGWSVVGGVHRATEWSGGSVIFLPGVAHFESFANAINDVGQVVGFGNAINDIGQEVGIVATEWSGGSVIDLGVLPGYVYSIAYGINDAGVAVGVSFFPEPTTWTMMLLGFAGMGVAGYRRGLGSRA
jgi:probable HAF family extracellular repeat protein